VVEELHRVLVQAVDSRARAGSRRRPCVGDTTRFSRSQLLRLHPIRPAARGALHEIVQRLPRAGRELAKPRTSFRFIATLSSRCSCRTRMAVLDVAVLRHAEGSEGPGGIEPPGRHNVTRTSLFPAFAMFDENTDNHMAPRGLACRRTATSRTPSGFRQLHWTIGVR